MLPPTVSSQRKIHSIVKACYTVLYCVSRKEENVVCALCLSNHFVLLLNQQPADCRILIEKLKACSDEQLLVELQHIKTWNIGKVSPKEKTEGEPFLWELCHDNISVMTGFQLVNDCVEYHGRKRGIPGI